MDIIELLVRMSSAENNIIFGTIRGINHFDLDNIIICSSNIIGLILSKGCI